FSSAKSGKIVERAWANRLPDCDFLFHVDGKPLGPMRYELERTCAALGIPYGRAKGSCSATPATRPSPTSSRRAPEKPLPCRLPGTRRSDRFQPLQRAP